MPDKLTWHIRKRFEKKGAGYFWEEAGLNKHFTDKKILCLLWKSIEAFSPFDQKNIFPIFLCFFLVSVGIPGYRN
jgi:hypothetical protein